MCVVDYDVLIDFGGWMDIDVKDFGVVYLEEIGYIFVVFIL